MSEPRDGFGNKLRVGDVVLRAYRSGTMAAMEFRRVERIENGRLYLNGSKGSYVTNYRNLLRWPDDVVPAYTRKD